MYFLLTFLIYNLISYININYKKNKIITSFSTFNQISKTKFLNSYKNKIESKLFNLGFPYKLTTQKYLIVKYLFSLFIALLAFINYKDIKAFVIFYTLTFFAPDFLLFNFKNNEKNILLNEVKNLTESIILNLSAYATLEQALIKSKIALKYPRFINAYDKFIYEYKMNGYDLKEATYNLETKFSSYELSLFLTTLIQGDIEGNLLENLKKFSDTLELNYFKYLKKKSAQRIMYVTLGTVLSLVNIVLVVMYPMFKQVLDSLQILFN